MKKPDNNSLILLMVLAVAAVARYWGIGFGLPNTQCRPDESMIVSIVYAPLRHFHPGNFLYPSLYKYIVLFFYAVYFIFGAIIQKYGSYTDLLKEYIINPGNFYLINRSLSALMGTATVFVVYKITEKIFDRRTALIASFFLSLAYLHVRDSHFGTCDVPVTFFIMMSVLYIVRSYHNNNIGNYMLAGIFAGLAMSVKYLGVLLFIPMLVTHFSNSGRIKNKKGNPPLDIKLSIFTAALPAGFLLGTPYVLFDFNNFIKDVFFQTQALEQWGAISLGVGWWHYLRFTLLFGLGFNLLLASLIGAVMIVIKDIRKALILCSFPFSYYILVGSGNTAFSRYMVPIVPFLCITAAAFTMYIIDRIIKHCRPDVRIFPALIIIWFIIFSSMRNVIIFDRLLDRKDNRLIASEWIKNNLKKNNYCAHVGSLWGKAQLQPEEIILSRAAEPPEDKTLPDIDKQPEYEEYLRIKKEILTNSNISGLKESRYDTVADLFYNEKADLPEYVILEESPLRYYSPVPEREKKFLEKKYTLIKEFKVISIDNNANLFDQFDAFYVPLAGFKDIQRPGPNLYIFKKKNRTIQ